MKQTALLTLLLLLAPTLQAEQQDALHYRLSYSGLLTGFIWKDLADVTLRLTPEPATLREHAAKRLSMDVTTAEYGVAEAIHPIRYRWESTLSEDLQRTLQVTIIDTGESDSHEIFWYDWEDNLISAFRKRQQVDVSIPMFHEAPVLEWEKDHIAPPPEFLDTQPPVAPGLSYMLMTQRLPDRLNSSAIDPIAMFHRLRWHDFASHPSTSMQILFEDELAPYVANRVGTRQLRLEGCAINANTIEILKGDENGEEGKMTLWLSDDEQRLPLRIDVDAPLGELHLQLQSLPPAFVATNCKAERRGNAFFD